MTRFVRSASLLFSGLFAGFLVCVLVLENSLRGYDAAVYTQTRLVELDSLDKLASATLIPALITTAVLVVRARGNNRRLVLVALVLLVVVFATTLAVNLPINSDQAAWSVQNPPSDWASVRDGWQVAHAIRTAAAVVAFGLLIVAGQRKSVGRSGRLGNAAVQAGVR
ncbi:anthrone oxygenase family protein [Kribbella sp. NPDC051586]|uniref:anthrone oxygenase family protein n=1 Tax=Kribbella sp. NPDC051586 TaxID=3364118 RepID=UPI0037A2A4EA